MYDFIGREIELDRLKNDFDDTVVKNKKCLSYLIQGRKDVGKTEIVLKFIENIENDIGLKSEIPKFNRSKNVISFSCTHENKKEYAAFQVIKDEIEKITRWRKIISSLFSVIMAFPIIGVNDLLEAGKKLYGNITGSYISFEEIEKKKKIIEFNRYRKTLKKYSKNVPLILFFQNIQYLDEYSLFLIERLVANDRSFWGMIILEEDTSNEYDDKVQKSLSRMLNSGLMHSMVIMSLENVFPQKLLAKKFGEAFFSSEENDTLFVISEGCPGKLITFIEECVHEGWLYQENSEWKKVEDFSQLIRPRFQKLLELIIQTLEDGIITDAELTLIKKFSKVWNIPLQTVNNVIAMLKDITNLKLNILGRLGPGIIGKISLLVSDENDNRFILEHFPLENLNNEIQVDHLDLNNNKYLWEANEIKICNEGILISWDYIDGKKTRDELIAANELHLKRNVEKISQVLNGLNQLHNKNIPHFFIRPESIIETDEGKYKLVVVNNAIFNYFNIEQSNLFSSRENLNYMAPEQLEKKNYDLRSDIFSIGVLLYKSLTGHFPFYGTKEYELINSIRKNNVDFDGNLMLHVPEEYQKIIRKCLAFNPDDRYQNAEELLNELPKTYPSPPHVINSLYKLNEEIQEEIKKLPKDWTLEKIKSHLREKHHIVLTNDDIVEQLRTQKHSYSALAITLSFLIIFVLFINFWNDIFNGKKLVLTTPIVLDIEDSKRITQDSVIDASKINYLLKLFIQSQDTLSLTENEFSKIYGSNSEIDYLPNKIIRGVVDRTNNGFTLEGGIIDNNNNSSNSFSYNFREPAQLLNGITHQLMNKIPISNNRTVTFTSDWDAFDAFYNAEQAWAKLDITKAMHRYEESLSIDPNFVLPKLKLADVYRWKGKTQVAQYTLNEVIDKLSELSTLDSLNGKALEARLKGDLRSAIRISKDIINLKPEDKEPPYNVAELYFQLCDIERAIGYYKQSLRHDSLFTSSINHLAYCYSHLGDHEKALRLFRRYVKIDSTANAFDSWGDGFLGAAKLDSAEWAKEEGIKIDSDLAYLYSSLAYINIRQGKFKKANENIFKYINSPGATDQIKAVGLFIKSLNLFEKQDYQNALDTCLKAKSIFDSKDIVTRDHDMHWLLSRLYIKNNMLDSAKAELNQMQEIIKRYTIDNTNYHKILKYKYHIAALIAMEENDLTKLDEIYNILSTQLKTKIKDHGSPFGPAYLFTSFSEIYRNLGLFKNAEAAINQALDYADNYPMAHYNLWKLFEETNETEKADEAKIKFNNLWSNADKELKQIFGIESL